MGRKKRMSKASLYSRKKKEDEMVPARQFEVNECKSITTARRIGSWNSLLKAKVEIMNVFEG